ncbi:MAG TPA: type II toxin-antitoxin system antitoxin SocA domain-containing protein [Bacteroidia bacterium]
MKSPLTGKDMILKSEKRVLEFRKENFEVQFNFYLCTDSSEQFTDTSLDELNMNQLYNQYRAKHNLPFPEEIIAIRDMYDLPANKMSEILGFGVNSYRNYENGEVPAHSNGKLIQLAADPMMFKQLLEKSEGIEDAVKQNILKRIEALLDAKSKKKDQEQIENYLLNKMLPDEFSGFKKPDLNRLREMVVFFSNKMKPWKTQMNKLLFYADFICYKNTGYSMSGMRYRAIPLGPVPNNFNSLFEYLANQAYIQIEATDFHESIGERLLSTPKYKFNSELFSDKELEILNTVYKKFKSISTKRIIEMSHKEKGWIENVKQRSLISYKYAFELNQSDLLR